MSVRYDFHLHSCLSPCGDEDMTPYNLTHMAALAGLDVVALTDHNSCKNCPAAAKAAEDAGIRFLPGMELCTAEDIHVVCLFPDLERAMAFDARVEAASYPVKNKPEKFGRQEIRNERDELLGEEERLLIMATAVKATEVNALVREYGGVCFPAHVDKTAYGILSVLGGMPPECEFRAFELSPRGDFEKLRAKHPVLSDMTLLRNSDAHRLEDIGLAEGVLDCDADIESIFRALGA